MTPSRALAILLFVTQFFCAAAQERKVLLIGIDGCRSDALQQANTPNIDGLLANALYTFDSWHVGITWSGPSWSTILTGVHWNKHGVTNNTFSGSDFNDYPAFPKRAKEIKPGLNCVEVVEWDPLADDFYNDGWDKKIKVADGSTFPTADSAVIQLQDTTLDALFVYFDKVDLTGHSTTFSPSNSQYINAIELVDSAVGIVLASLYARPTYAGENWLILLVTDHGGNSFFHGANSFEERHIWWIANGAAVPQEQINAADPGTYNCQLINIFDTSCVDLALLKQSPIQPDIAVTAIHHLIYDSGINPETKPEWQLDGKSWLTPPTAIRETRPDNALQIFPNPAEDVLRVALPENIFSGTVKAEIFDLNGKLQRSLHLAAQPAAVIDLRGLNTGLYSLRLTARNETRQGVFSVK